MINKTAENSLSNETSGTPLVTFALFAYNQEKYIREAVEGAFAQTYEPLEIILSDDCSTDRTFEIMEEMAAGYKGPHSIKIRRSLRNLGLGLHIADIVKILNSHFVVVAAGDDVSLPERTAVLVELMQKERTEFAASNYNKMTNSGVITDLNLGNDYSGNYVWTVIDADVDYFANGATAAYRTKFLRGALDAAIVTINTGKLFNEDILFAAYAVAINTKPSSYTKLALLNYRINPSSLSNFKKNDSNFLSELEIVKRERFRSATRLAVLGAITEIATKHHRLASLLKCEKIEYDKRLCVLELSASENSFFRRLRVLLTIKNMRELKLCLARIWGLKALALVRFVRRRINGH